MRRNGRDAPRPVIARTTIEFADATTFVLARTTWWAAPITVPVFVLRPRTAKFGVIVAVRRQVRRFSKKEITLLENFAADPGIAREILEFIEEHQVRSAAITDGI